MDYQAPIEIPSSDVFLEMESLEAGGHASVRPNSSPWPIKLLDSILWNRDPEEIR